MSRRLHRYVVPVDDRPLVLELTSGPLHVAAIDEVAVEFWTEHTDGKPRVRRAFQVFGTGHDLPDGAIWIGTCHRLPSGLVWHLYEVTP